MTHIELIIICIPFHMKLYEVKSKPLNGPYQSTNHPINYLLSKSANGLLNGVFFLWLVFGGTFGLSRHLQANRFVWAACQDRRHHLP